MSGNSDSFYISSKHISLTISILVLIFAIFATFVYTKADKKELEKVEKRCTERIMEFKTSVRDDISRLEKKADETLDILLRVHHYELNRHIHKDEEEYR